tara:strand:+ start:6106 stop:9021 length:2916 start_codon:yes stop_codon:yes gene_type:complete
MMKVLYSFCLLISLLTSTVVIADNLKLDPNCGLQNNIVQGMNTEVCTDDLFITSLNDFLPVTSKEFLLEDITDVAELMEQKENYNPSFAIERTLADYISPAINYIILSIFITLFSMFAWFQTNYFMAEGKFNTQYSKTWVISIATAFFLIIPINGFTVIQIGFGHIPVYAAKTANFVWSTVLDSYQDENLAGIDLGAEDKAIRAIETDKFGHNKAYAYTYVSSLTKSALCKTQTNLHLNLSEIFNPTSISPDRLYLGNETKFLNSTAKSDEVFVNFTDKLVATDHRITNGVVFGKPTSQKRSSAVFDFECGSLQANITKVKDTEIEDLVLKIGLYKAVEGTLTDIKQISEEGIQSTVNSGASSLLNAGATELGLKDIREANTPEKNILRKLNFIYHQQVLAALLTGYAVNTNGLAIKEYSFILRKNLESAEAIARTIRTDSCLDNPESVVNSIQGYSTLQSGRTQIGASTACLDVDKDRVVGVLGSSNNQGFFKSKVDLELAKRRNQAEQEQLIDSFVNEIASIRTAVERSFTIEAVKIDNTQALFRDLRRQGFLAMKHSLLELEDTYGSTDTYKAMLRTTVSQNSAHLRDNFITTDGIEDLTSDFPILDSNFSRAFKGIELVGSEITDLDFGTFTDTYIQESSMNNISSASFTDSVLNTLKSPISQAIYTYNLDAGDCDGKPLCSARIDSPTGRMVDLGNNMVNTSATLMASSFIISTALTGIEKGAGSLSRGNSKKVVGKASNLVKGGASVAQSVLDTLSTIIWILFVAGWVLGYVLPIVLSVIIGLSYAVYWLGFCFMFISIPFFALRFLTVSTGRDYLIAVSSGLQIIFYFMFYPALLVVSAVLALATWDVSYDLISYVVLTMFSSELTAGISLTTMIIKVVLLVTVAVFSFLLNLKVFRMANDIPLKVLDAIFNSEKFEESFVDGVKVFSGSLVTFAQQFSEISKRKHQKQLEKRREERQQKETDQ